MNYDAKSKNIVDAAAEFQLSKLTDFAFLDDDPVQIGEVQANAPGVVCLHVPTERPDDYARAVWALDALKATHEDKKRHDNMKAEAARQEARPIDFGEWIASLEIKVEFSTPSTEEEKARTPGPDIARLAICFFCDHTTCAGEEHPQQ